MSPEFIGDRASEKRLESATWGVFSLWMGIALLAGLGWGVSLLGIGVILWGAQIARRSIGLPIESWGVVLGAMFILGALAEFLRAQLGIHIGLLPIFCIVAGAALLMKAFAHTREAH